MTLETITALIETLDSADHSFESIADALRFLDSTGERTISENSLGELLCRDSDTVEPVLFRLQQCRVIQPQGRNPVEYTLNRSDLDRLEKNVSWLSENYSISRLESMADLRVTDLDLLYTVPANATVSQRSNMTGQLVDLVSNADDEVSVVTPFFSDVGVDTIAEALAAATDRDVSVSLLTRDLYTGDQSNQKYITTICDNVRENGKLGHFRVLEFNRNEFSDSTLHAKIIVADGERAYVGSANMTEASLRRSLEVGVHFEGAAATELHESLEEFRTSSLFIDRTEEVL